MIIFLIIGIIAFIAIIILGILVIEGSFWYERFQMRNKEITKLAGEFGLSFKSCLPTFWRFIFKYPFTNIQINEVIGTIKSHSVNIKDGSFRSAVSVWVGNSVPFLPNIGSGRLTTIEIDGQRVPYSNVSIPILRTSEEIQYILSRIA